MSRKCRSRCPFDKATPDRLEEAIVNFDEVRARLAGTGYAEQV